MQDSLTNLPQGRPLISGIINLTPDSFSDGGKYNTVARALVRAQEMEQQGADWLELGGESTGPNSKSVSLLEEFRRVMPVLKVLRQKVKLPIVIDTYKASLAEAALQAGANLINDVTALRGDPKMAAVIAQFNCPVVLMFARDATPRTKIVRQTYSDLIATIKAFFEERLAFASKQGIQKNKIILDPGLGHFVSAIPKYSYEIILRLNEFKELKHKILLGISRKSFLGGAMETRDWRGLPLAGMAYLNGVAIIRTHEVKNTRAFFRTLI